MGYALFTARKLALNSRVNSINAKLACISNKRNSITNELQAQQVAATMRENAATKSALENYYAAGGEGDFSLFAAQAKDTNAEAKDSIRMLDLQQQDSLLDVQQKSLETQLKAAQEELQAVEKAEESAIKNATPKYCA